MKCHSTSVGDLDPEPDPHVLGLKDQGPLVRGTDPDPLVRGTDPDPAPDLSLFS
jgi:hypothetical protein